MFIFKELEDGITFSGKEWVIYYNPFGSSKPEHNQLIFHGFTSLEAARLFLLAEVEFGAMASVRMEWPKESVKALSSYKEGK